MQKFSYFAHLQIRTYISSSYVDVCIMCDGWISKRVYEREKNHYYV